eukprot:TRINITY_DN7006_c1_g1_i3.p1 TRINITY_DN7006_c1_g1~~TRINITY_DN7006_c1_g1_i3.p1  ORF type:complete len:281 (-),score=36.45 TRINITY_DN7006_c1_g1_i3:157-927(-)
MTSFDLTPLKNIFSNGTARVDWLKLQEITRQLAEFDIKMNQVVVDSGVLAGITKEQIMQKALQIETQKMCLEVLENCKTNDIVLAVISINWSACLIQTTLSSLNLNYFNGKLQDDTQIKFGDENLLFSNELVFDEISRQSTGGIVKYIESSQDKDRTLQVLLQAFKQQFGDMLSIFVGDSLGDILPLLRADLGIIVGNKKYLVQVVEAVGLQIVPLMEAEIGNKGKLYYVSGWEEIAAFLSWRIKKYQKVQPLSKA